jgi:hypothetical protein
MNTSLTVDPVLGRLEVVCSSILIADNRGYLRRLWIQEDPICALYCIAALKNIIFIREKDKDEKKGPRLEQQGHGEERRRRR